jgi:hypothetical protein
MKTPLDRFSDDTSDPSMDRCRGTHSVLATDVGIQASRGLLTRLEQAKKCPLGKKA